MSWSRSAPRRRHDPARTAPGPGPAGPDGGQARPGPAAVRARGTGTRGVARPPPPAAGGRLRSEVVPQVDVATAEAMTTWPGVPGPGQEPAGLPGSNNKMLAVAAISTLRTIPEPLVTESMPCPSSSRPRHAPAQLGVVVPPGANNFSGTFPLRRSVPRGRGWVMGRPVSKVDPAGRSAARYRAGRGQVRAPAGPAGTRPGHSGCGMAFARRRPAIYFCFLLILRSPRPGTDPAAASRKQIPRRGSPHPCERYSLIPPGGSADTPGGFSPQRGPIAATPRRYSSSDGLLMASSPLLLAAGIARPLRFSYRGQAHHKCSNDRLQRAPLRRIKYEAKESQP